MRALLALSLVVLAASVPASASEQQPSGLIAFSRSQPFWSAIWVVEAATGVERQLTFPGDRVYDACPDWSPDGKRIAFARFRDIAPRTGGIYVMRADGSSRRRLTRSRVRGTHPSWSPDGRRLALGCAEGVCVMRSDGSDRRVLARNASAPAWSPSGRWIAYVRCCEGVGVPPVAAVVVSSPDGNRRKTLARVQLARELHWLPDGRLAFWSRAGDFVVDAESGSGGRIPRVGAFSPDGQYVAYSRHANPCGTAAECWFGRIAVAASSGEGERDLTQTVFPGADAQPDWRPRP